MKDIGVKKIEVKMIDLNRLRLIQGGIIKSVGYRPYTLLSDINASSTNNNPYFQEQQLVGNTIPL